MRELTAQQKQEIVDRARSCCEYCLLHLEQRLYPTCRATPTGRATVEKLQLNREGIINLRRILRLVNQHPPALDP